MNLSHRLADRNLGFSHLTFFKVAYLKIVLPIFIFLLSLYSLISLFGQQGETGGLSLIFIPIIGPSLVELFETPNIFLSMIVLAGYALGPVCFYWFVYAITRRHLTAFLTAILSLLPRVPFLPEAPARLVHAFLEKDGGHILALTLVAAAATFYLHYIRSGKLIHLVSFIVVSIFISLASFFGVFVLFLFMLFISISEILVAQGRIKFRRSFLCCVLIIGFVLLFYNAAIILMILSDQGQATLSVLSNLIPMSFFLIPVLGIVTFLIFDRRPALQPLFLASIFLITFGLFHFIGVVILDSALFNQQRYTAEAEFAVNFFTAFIITSLFDGIRAGFFIDRFKSLDPYRNQLAFGLVLTIIVVLLSSVLFIPHTI